MPAIESTKITKPRTFTPQCISNVPHEEEHFVKLSTPSPYPKRAVKANRPVVPNVFVVLLPSG